MISLGAKQCGMPSYMTVDLEPDVTQFSSSLLLVMAVVPEFQYLLVFLNYLNYVMIPLEKYRW